MTDIKVSEIERLRLEAELDLDALRRVESMVKRLRSDSVVNSVSVKPSTPDRTKGPKNFGLKSRVGEILSGAGDNGLRPRDIVNVLESEFDFTNRQNAAAAISAALSRFRKAGKATKLKTGRYIWANDNSAE